MDSGADGMDPERQTESPEHRRRETPAAAEIAAAAEADPATAAAPAEWWANRRPPRHDARALTGAGGEAEILLDGTRYVLRITRQRKLILTK
jgi:hemin uptake protein HemP